MNFGCHLHCHHSHHHQEEENEIRFSPKAEDSQKQGVDMLPDDDTTKDLPRDPSRRGE